MILIVKKECDRFGVTEEQALQLEVTIIELEGRLTPSRCFDSFKDAMMDNLRNEAHYLANVGFLEELQTSTGLIYAALSSRLGSPTERPSDRLATVGVMALFILRGYLGGETHPPDKKLCRSLFELHKKAPLIFLYSSSVLLPTEFLLESLPPVAVALASKESKRMAEKERQDYLEKLEAHLERELPILTSAVCAWLARFDSCLPPKSSLQQVLLTRLKLVVQGMYLASRVRVLLQTCIHLHVALDQPITKHEIRCLAQCMELIKVRAAVIALAVVQGPAAGQVQAAVIALAVVQGPTAGQVRAAVIALAVVQGPAAGQAIDAEYHRRTTMSASSISHLLFFSQGRLHRILVPVRDALNSELSALRSGKSVVKSFFSTEKVGSEEVKLDALAATTLAMDSLGGPACYDRRILLQLAVDVLRDTGRLKEE
eukprot:gene25737-31480_t